MSKLKAFTVLEVLITMGVMSIIISLTYFLYSSFSQQTFFFQKSSETSQNFEKFVTLLRRDFFDAETVLKTENGFEISFYGDQKTINYRSENKKLTRIQNNQKITLEYRDINFKTIENKPNFISKVLLNATFFNEVINIELKKDYPPNYSIEF